MVTSKTKNTACQQRCPLAHETGLKKKKPAFGTEEFLLWTPVIFEKRRNYYIELHYF